MTSLYNVRFKNQDYSLNKKQVDDLLLIGSLKGSSTEILLELRDARQIEGTVIDFKGYSVLFPYDVYIPIEFKIKINEEDEHISFLDIISFEILN